MHPAPLIITAFFELERQLEIAYGKCKNTTTKWFIQYCVGVFLAAYKDIGLCNDPSYFIFKLIQFALTPFFDMAPYDLQVVMFGYMFAYFSMTRKGWLTEHGSFLFINKYKCHAFGLKNNPLDIATMLSISVPETIDHSYRFKFFALNHVASDCTGQNTKPHYFCCDKTYTSHQRTICKNIPCHNELGRYRPFVPRIGLHCICTLENMHSWLNCMGCQLTLYEHVVTHMNTTL